MHWQKFSIGFWHPFGVHAGELRDDILDRKMSEIESQGWTLWSFQHRKTLNIWFDILKLSIDNNVYVFCSDSKNAQNPQSSVVYCKQYQPIDNQEWLDIPQSISVPHPMAKRAFGSAFIVENIYRFSDTPLVDFAIAWYGTADSKWRNESLPTRGEYLIKKGGATKTRKIYAVLKLRYPFLATLRG